MFFQPVRSLNLNAGLSWLPKRELTEDQVNATVEAPGRKGDNLPRIPEYTANFSVQYELAGALPTGRPGFAGTGRTTAIPPSCGRRQPRTVRRRTTTSRTSASARARTIPAWTLRST